MIVFFFLLQVALVAAQSKITKVTAFEGATVVLPSGASEPETLTDIAWSIFSNDTAIATFNRGTFNVEWIDQFKGRLSLDPSSGNLTVSSVRLSDAMVYKVDCISNLAYKVHQVDLSVRERLQKPALAVLGSASNRGRCFALLQCSPPEDGASLSWQLNASGVSAFQHTVGRHAVLLAVINQTQGHVSAGCTASVDGDHASDAVTAGCPGEPPMASLPPAEEVPPWRGRTALAASLFFFFGVLAGALLALVSFTQREAVNTS